jgi:hypothetical protein
VIISFTVSAEPALDEPETNVCFVTVCVSCESLPDRSVIDFVTFVTVAVAVLTTGVGILFAPTVGVARYSPDLAVVDVSVLVTVFVVVDFTAGAVMRAILFRAESSELPAL